MDSEIIDTDILIVGAGVAGLTLATALADSRYKVLIIDRRSELKDINRGDILLPSTLRNITNIGAIVNLNKYNPIKNSQYHIDFYNENYLTLDLLKIDKEFPYTLSLHHESIENAFLDKIKDVSNITILFNTNCKYIENYDDRAVSFVHSNGRDIRINSKLIIAADGRDSKIRESINIIPKICKYKDSFFILEGSMLEGFEDGIKMLIGDMNILVVPLSKEKIRITFALAKSKIMKISSMHKQDLEEYLRSKFKKLNNISLDMDGAHLYRLTKYNVLNYYYKRCALIGDSAHTIHPFTGHGMTMAINDAFILSKLLLEEDNIDEVLKAYNKDAYKFNKTLIKEMDKVKIFYNISTLYRLNKYIKKIVLYFPLSKKLFERIIIKMYKTP